MDTIIGLDIGGTKTAILEGTYEADILQRHEIPTQAQDGFPVTFERICAEVESIMQTAKQLGRMIGAVSVSIGGPLKIDEGIILAPPHLPRWVNVPLKTLLAQRFNLPVFVEHDGNAGALAEYFFGAGRGARNIIFLTAGTGLGGGFIIEGQLYRGTTDTAGEVGHIRLANEGPMEYGKAGSWEAFCSGEGMLKLAQSMFPGHYPDALTTRDLVDAALEGDEIARQVIHKSGEWLGRGLAVLIDTLNPQVVVLGSLGGALGDLFLQPARDVVLAECLPQPADACRIVPAQLGTRLGDVAALIAAIHMHRQSTAAPSPTISTPSSALAVTLQDSLRVQMRMSDIAEVIEKSARAICRALQDGRKVIVFGNGGSATQAQHLAGELVGKYGPARKSLPSIALTADSGVVTCIANDFGYEHVFSRQVEAFAQPGDVVIGITTSGRSLNVIQGLDAGRERGAVTVAMTGERGLVGSSADFVIPVPSGNTARIQEGHAFIVHYWCDVIDAEFTK